MRFGVTSRPSFRPPRDESLLLDRGAAGVVVADGKRLEAAAFGPPPDAAPTIVLLHEGLGCVALWRDFPEKLAAATGFGVFVYFARRLRKLRSGRPAAAARLHDPRGALEPAADPRRDRIPSGHPARPQRRRVDRRDLRRRASGRAGEGPRSDRAAPLHRAAGPRLDRRGEACLRRRATLREKLAKYHAARRQRVPRLERRVARPRLQGLEHRGIRRPAGASRRSSSRARTTSTARWRRSAPSRRGRPRRSTSLDPRGLPSFAASRAARGDARGRAARFARPSFCLSPAAKAGESQKRPARRLDPRFRGPRFDGRMTGCYDFAPTSTGSGR